MGVTRKYVFPALRIIAWLIIAAALVKLAFNGAELEAQDTLVPTGEITESTLVVEKGEVSNAVTLPATVVEDTSIEVRATAIGKVSYLHTDDGKVAKDDPLVEIRFEEPVEPTIKVDEETGEETITENAAKVTYTTVKAPVSGTIDITVLKDQELTVGESVGTISPGTLSVSGTLTADQQYRLVGAPDKAKVTLKGGPKPFTCTSLRIGSAGSAANSGQAEFPGESGESAATATGAVTCKIPKDVTAFAGLGAEIEIKNGDAKDTVVVPVTAVLGSAESGSVWIMPDDGEGEPEEREVGLGLTDGKNVQVTKGLKAGETILEFTPVPDATEEGGIDCDDMAAFDEAAMSGDEEAMMAYEEACFG